MLRSKNVTADDVDHNELFKLVLRKREFLSDFCSMRYSACPRLNQLMSTGKLKLREVRVVKGDGRS